MKAKDLFTIILKVFGIYLIKDVLLTIPPIIANLHEFFAVSADIGVFSIFVSLLLFGLYFGIVYLLLFKTNWLISKLNLTADLSAEPLAVNVHRSSVYSIAIIVTGILILVFAIPQLIKHLYTWFEYTKSRNRMMVTHDYDYSPILTRLTEVIIGVLFLVNQRTLVNLIEARRRASKVD